MTNSKKRITSIALTNALRFRIDNARGAFGLSRNAFIVAACNYLLSAEFERGDGGEAARNVDCIRALEASKRKRSTAK
jgi:hypothetical protein